MPPISVDFHKLAFVIADDSAFMRQILRTMLVGFGARRIIDVADGAAALEAVERHRPDVLILDWVMPIVDGLEATRFIRGSSARDVAATSIVMMTAHATRARVTQARDAGVTEYIVKPLSPRVLHDRIAACVLTPRSFVRTKSYFGPDRRRHRFQEWTGEERRLEAKPAADFELAE